MINVLFRVWGILGVCALLLNAILRLGPRALEPFAGGLPDTWVLVAYAVSIVLMAHSEGYRGFQKGFSPRVVARAFAIGPVARPWQVVLAPMVCMGLLHATKKRRIVGWSLVTGIVCLVLLVRLLPQPLRGAIDAGVVVGLLWGLVAILVFLGQSLAGKVPAVPTDLPDQDDKSG